MSTTFVIFGASGDLTWRKLIPALYNNFAKGRLDHCDHIIGFARRPMTDAALLDHLREGVRKISPDTFQEAIWQEFSIRIHYFQGNLEVPDDFTRLDTYLRGLEKSEVDRLYYLATAPEHFAPAVMSLSAAGMLLEEQGWRRVIIEKPFGTSLTTAMDLDRIVHSVLKETQVYRIDHYLGKETAQNILFFRFANTIFEPVWNRRYINNIQLTVAETIGVEDRAGYYEEAGVLRDMFQNHILQLLSLVAMEPPAAFDSESVRNETVKVLRSIHPLRPNDAVLAQYNGYCDLEGVATGSQIPTYAALRLYIDNWRWHGVPFYLRSGKSLTRKVSEIVIVFQRPPHLMFHLQPGVDFLPNILSLCIQPDEGIQLRFQVKAPGMSHEMRAVDMDFNYTDSFSDALPDAYERLLLEALEGDQSLFTRSDAIEASWKLIDPLIEAWEGPDSPGITAYQTGSWGPAEADALLAADGRSWRLECEW